jgi:flagellar export protein FliJ
MELAAAKRLLLQTRNIIETLERNRSDAETKLRSEETQGIDMNRHRLFSAYLRGVTAQIAEANDRLVEIAGTVSEKQQAFDAERIKRESLVLLKQKKYADYIEAINRADQKAADELMSLRWRPDHAVAGI